MSGLSLRKRTDGSWGVWDSKANGWANGIHYGDKKYAKFDKNKLKRRRKQK